MATVTLRVLDGSDRGRTFSDLDTPVTIGREEGNTIQLNDERISRYHLKIQEDNDKLVLTDLESTNGTKVNGEDIQLRILRFGDMISLGRSVLLFGSEQQIQERLATLRNGLDEKTQLADEDVVERAASLDFDLNWNQDPDLQATLHTLDPPSLPERLSPGQAAQMAELLEYLHIRVRQLISSVKMDAGASRITLDAAQWQGLLDLQARLGVYLREIGDPDV